MVPNIQYDFVKHSTGNLNKEKQINNYQDGIVLMDKQILNSEITINIYQPIRIIDITITRLKGWKLKLN